MVIYVCYVMDYAHYPFIYLLDLLRVTRDEADN